MAKTRVTKRPAWVEDLLQTLEVELRGVGIDDADVVAEPIPGTRLHRITVITPKFRAMRPSERQNLVWRIAETVLSPEHQLRVSMILTLTPEEIAGED